MIAYNFLKGSFSNNLHIMVTTDISWYYTVSWGGYADFGISFRNYENNDSIFFGKIVNNKMLTK